MGVVSEYLEYSHIALLSSNASGMLYQQSLKLVYEVHDDEDRPSDLVMPNDSDC